MPAVMRIRVVLALPAQTREQDVEVAPGSDAGTVLRCALERGLSLLGTGLDPDTVALGVFGQPVERGTALNDLDRLELYRPLQQDPMARRRREAGPRFVR